MPNAKSSLMRLRRLPPLGQTEGIAPLHLNPLLTAGLVLLWRSKGQLPVPALLIHLLSLLRAVASRWAFTHHLPPPLGKLARLLLRMFPPMLRPPLLRMTPHPLAWHQTCLCRGPALLWSPRTGHLASALTMRRTPLPGLPHRPPLSPRGIVLLWCLREWTHALPCCLLQEIPLPVALPPLLTHSLRIRRTPRNIGTLVHQTTVRLPLLSHGLSFKC